MKILLLDFETQGLDPVVHPPTEVGALMVSQGEEIAELSELLYDGYAPQTPEIVELTGITDELLKTQGKSPHLVFSTYLYPMIKAADVVVAHNAAFDRAVYTESCRRLKLPLASPKNGWLCSINDVPWAKKYKCKKLSHLAYDHGILVDPSTLHRALDDVRLLAQLLGKYDFEAIVKYRDTPWVYLRAAISAPWTDQGVGVAQARALGYRWQDPGDGRIFTKLWVKRVKEDQLEAEKQAAPFKIMRLVPDGEPPAA